MVTIKMNRNSNGSPDGHTVVHYEEGKEYDVPQGLADIFVAEKVADLVENKAEAKATTKAEPPLKNKAEAKA